MYRFHMALHLLSFSCELGLLVVTLLHLRAHRDDDSLRFSTHQYLFISFSFFCTVVACLGNIVGARRICRDVRRALTLVAVSVRDGVQTAKVLRSPA